MTGESEPTCGVATTDAAGDTAGEAVTGVGRTALGVAMMRAMESRRRDRLFEDPYAAAFLAAAPDVFDPAEQGSVAFLSGLSHAGSAFWSHAVLRTRFFDDHLLAVAERGIRQVVLLAAGLDTRAYRLAWPPGVRLFELDLAGVLAFKQRVLYRCAATPSCDRRPVPADLRGDWTAPLTAAGLQPNQPTAWLLEGLLIYLSADEVARLLTALDILSTAGSEAAFEFEAADATTLRERATTLPAMTEYAALWQGGLPDPPGWLAAHSWRLEIHDRGDISTRYGRAAGTPGGGYVTATRA